MSKWWLWWEMLWWMGFRTRVQLPPGPLIKNVKNLENSRDLAFFVDPTGLERGFIGHILFDEWSIWDIYCFICSIFMTEITIKRVVFEQIWALYIYLLHYSMNNMEQRITIIRICSMEANIPHRNRWKLEQIAIKKALCSNGPFLKVGLQYAKWL